MTFVDIWGSCTLSIQCKCSLTFARHRCNKSNSICSRGAALRLARCQGSWRGDGRGKAGAPHGPCSGVEPYIKPWTASKPLLCQGHGAAAGLVAGGARCCAGGREAGATVGAGHRWRVWAGQRGGRGRRHVQGAVRRPLRSSVMWCTWANLGGAAWRPRPLQYPWTAYPKPSLDICQQLASTDKAACRPRLQHCLKFR